MPVPAALLEVLTHPPGSAPSPGRTSPRGRHTLRATLLQRVEGLLERRL